MWLEWVRVFEVWCNRVIKTCWVGVRVFGA